MLESKRYSISVLMFLLILSLAAGCAKRGTSGGGEVGRPFEDQGRVVPESGDVPKAEEVLPDYVPAKSWDYASMPSPPPSGRPASKINDVAFDEGSTTLNRQGEAVCLVVKDWMDKNTARKVLIVGHASRLEATGEAAVTLARRRAEDAKSHMVQLGAPADRIEVASFGSEFSTADQAEPTLQSIERRVEFWSMP